MVSSFLILASIKTTTRGKSRIEHTFFYFLFLISSSGMGDIVNPMDHVNELCSKPCHRPQYEALQG